MNDEYMNGEYISDEYMSAALPLLLIYYCRYL